MNGWYLNYTYNGRVLLQHPFQNGIFKMKTNREHFAYLYGVKEKDISIFSVFYLNGTPIESEQM